MSRHSKLLFAIWEPTLGDLLLETYHSFRFLPLKYLPRPLARPFRISAEAAKSNCGALYGRASFYGSVAGPPASRSFTLLVLRHFTAVWQEKPLSDPWFESEWR